jgi:hypothetical protein
LQPPPGRFTLTGSGGKQPLRLDEGSDRLDEQRSKALGKAKKKAEKAAREAQQPAEESAALESEEGTRAA